MSEGAVIGAYQLIRQLGAGGMGVVWLAEHTMLGRRAALKALHPSFSSQQEIVTRFFNEARAATAISDPGIVQVFDFGQHTDGSAYIVMELLEGETLDRRLRRQGPFAVGEALRLIRQVASSLGAAHAHGIVHRDLKPENLFVVRDPEVSGGERTKILDFGIAKLGGDDGVQTQTSALMGTPAFMSPEQCRGAGQVDQRSDIYALGCVLFTLLTGRPPFWAEGAGELIVMHMRETPPLASMRATGIPASVDALIARCLAKDVADRPASGAALAAALGALLAELPQGAARAVSPQPGAFAPYVASETPPASYAIGSPPTTLSLSSASSEHAVQAVRSTRGLVVTALGAALVSLVLVLIAVYGSGHATDAGPTDARAAAASPPSDSPPPVIVIPPPPPPPLPASIPVVPAPVIKPPVPKRTPVAPREPTVKPESPSTVVEPAKPPQTKQSPRAFVDRDGDGIPDDR